MVSRYYDPETGRFINADDVSYIDPETVNGLNLYAYCGNNPVMYTDSAGCSWWDDFWNSTAGVIVGTILVVAAVVAITVLTAGVGTAITGALGGGFFASVIGGAIGGAISGAIIGAGLSIIGQGVVNGYGNIDWGAVGSATLAGAISGALLGGALGGLKYVKAMGSLNNVARTGQNHHVITNKINSALSRHSTLAGKFNRGDYIVKALNENAHKGYQAWHRAYDLKVVNWLAKNKFATVGEFKSLMNAIYKTADMVSRFGRYIPFR